MMTTTTMTTTTMRSRLLLTVLTAAAATAVVAGMPTELEMRQFIADMLHDDRTYAPVLAEQVKLNVVPQPLKNVVKDQNDVDPLVTLHKLKNMVSGGGGGRPWTKAATVASLYSGNALETSVTIAGSAYRCGTLKRVAVHVTLVARAAHLEPTANGGGVRAALLLAYVVPYAMDVLLAFGQPIAELTAVYNAVGLRPSTANSADPSTAKSADPSLAKTADPSPVRYTVDDGYVHRLSEQLPALDAAIAKTCVQSDTAQYYGDLRSKAEAEASAAVPAAAPATAAAATPAAPAAPAAAAATTAVNDLPLTTVMGMLEQNANAIVDAYDDALQIRNAGATTWKMAFGSTDLTLDSIGFRRKVRPGHYERTTAFLEQYWSNTVLAAAGGPAASQ